MFRLDTLIWCRSLVQDQTLMQYERTHTLTHTQAGGYTKKFHIFATRSNLLYIYKPLHISIMFIHIVVVYSVKLFPHTSVIYIYIYIVCHGTPFIGTPNCCQQYTRNYQISNE